MSLIRPLFAQVGSEERLGELLLEFYQRMSGDILIGFFFENKDIKQIAEHQKAFLLKAMGVTQNYTGKIPARAHDALAPILSGHFDRRLRILEQTLRDFGLDDHHVQMWIQFEETFRSQIVSD